MIGVLLLIASAPFLALAAEEQKPQGILEQIVKPITSLAQLPAQAHNAAQQLLPPIAPIFSAAGQFLNPLGGRLARAVGYQGESEAIIIPLPHRYPYFLNQQGPYPFFFGPQNYGPQSYGPQNYGPQSYGPQSYGPQGYAVVPLPFAPNYQSNQGPKLFYTLPKIYHSYSPQYQEQQEKTQTVTGKSIKGEVSEIGSKFVGNTGVEGVEGKKVTPVEGIVTEGESVSHTPENVKVTHQQH